MYLLRSLLFHHLFAGRLGLPLFVVVLSFSEATMAANGEGSEKGTEHPSAMSLFAPATQAAVSFHIHVMCLFFLFFELGVSYVGLGTVSTWSSSTDRFGLCPTCQVPVVQET